MTLKGLEEVNLKLEAFILVVDLFVEHILLRYRKLPLNCLDKLI